MKEHHLPSEGHYMSDGASYYDVITSLLYTNKILLVRSSWANFKVVWLI